MEGSIIGTLIGGEFRDGLLGRRFLVKAINVVRSFDGFHRNDLTVSTVA